MRALSRSIRVAVGAGLALGVVVLTAGPASAHVSVSGEVHAGGNGTFTFLVPNERDDASTTKLAVQIPEDVPLGSLRVQPKPGWTIATTTRTLTEPVEVFGEPVTEVIDTITWTAEGAGIGVDQFDTFSVRGGPFPEDATEVAFAAIQTYSSGEEVAWIEETVEGQDEPEHPAPVLALLPPESEEDDAATTDTTEADDAADAAATDDAAAASTSTEDDDDDSSNTLASVGIVIGLAGLATAAFALVTARRSETT